MGGGGGGGVIISSPGVWVKASTRTWGYAADFNKDAVAPSLEKLRAFPQISSTLSHLVQEYEDQEELEVIPGKNHSVRLKCGRYNTTETVTGKPEGRWPNEGFIVVLNPAPAVCLTSGTNELHINPFGK